MKIGRAQMVEIAAYWTRVSNDTDVPKELREQARTTSAILVKLMALGVPVTRIDIPGSDTELPAYSRSSQLSS